MDFLSVFSNPSGNIKKVLTKRRQEKKWENELKHMFLERYHKAKVFIKVVPIKWYSMTSLTCDNFTEPTELAIVKHRKTYFYSHPGRP